MENTISSERMSKQLGSNSSLGFRFFIAPKTEDFDDIRRLIIKGWIFFCLYANGFSEMEVDWRIYLCFSFCFYANGFLDLRREGWSGWRNGGG